MADYKLIAGSALETLQKGREKSIQCVVCSPPYFGLRSYLEAGDDDKHLEIGTEESPEQYVANLVEVFREVKRLLRDDGTLFLNLGDSYAGSNKGTMADGSVVGGKKQHTNKGTMLGEIHKTPTFDGIKAKDLIGIPWMTAFALRADGWYLRSAITWCKGNPMPESVTDRCTSATEMVFMLTKNRKYFYDNEAIKEPSVSDHSSGNGFKRNARLTYSDSNGARGSDEQWQDVGGTRNRRNWWAVNAQPYKEAHFATFPKALIGPCILAGTSEYGACAKCGSPWKRIVKKEMPPLRKVHTNGPVGGHGLLGGNRFDEPIRTTTTGWQATCACECDDVRPCWVLDPFCGAGTTGVVALEHGRRFIGVDLNPAYIKLSENRIQKEIYGKSSAVDDQ
jgi:DNA modification methylase